MASIDGVEIRGEMVTLTGAAERLGLDRRNLETYKHRDRAGRTRNPFPGPVAEIAGVSIWRWSDIEAWNARRRPRSSATS
jgi:hypothetical protein